MTGGPARAAIQLELTGAAGGFALFLLLWLFGAFSSTPPTPPHQPDLTPRFAAIEKQLNDLAARPAPERTRLVAALAEELS